MDENGSGKGLDLAVYRSYAYAVAYMETGSFRSAREVAERVFAQHQDMLAGCADPAGVIAAKVALRVRDVGLGREGLAAGDAGSEHSMYASDKLRHRRQLGSVIEALPEREQIVGVLYLVQDVSVANMVRYLGMDPQAVGLRLSSIIDGAGQAAERELPTPCQGDGDHDVALTLLASNGLPEAMRAETEDHLAACSECRAALDAKRQMLAELRQALMHYALPELPAPSLRKIAGVPQNIPRSTKAARVMVFITIAVFLFFLSLNMLSSGFRAVVRSAYPIYFVLRPALFMFVGWYAVRLMAKEYVTAGVKSMWPIWLSRLLLASGPVVAAFCVIMGFDTVGQTNPWRWGQISSRNPYGLFCLLAAIWGALAACVFVKMLVTILARLREDVHSGRGQEGDAAEG